MSISDSQKIDFLWKKTVYGVSNTGGTAKQGFEEAIGTSVPVYGNDIMAEALPVPAPGTTTSVVQYYAPASAIRMTADATVAGSLAWVATSTYNNLATRLTNWIAPSIDAGYLVEIYKNDPTVPANKLNGGTNNSEWVFDYTSGILRFVNTLPGGITSLHIVGYRYVGKTGLGGAGVNIRDAATTYEGATVTSGTYIMTNFFEYAPQSQTVTVEFNGQRMESTQWSAVGRDLYLILDQLPFDLEDGDVVSARYAFAG
jgi:hypothetical protein